LINDSIVVLSGGFDPIHSGHIELIKEARKIGRVILALNSDEWLTRKKGKPFMPFEERKAVFDQFKNVLNVISFDDSNNNAVDAIHQVKNMFPNHKIIFANGGDRTQSNIPEIDYFVDDPLVEFAFSIGGNTKKNSSSWILSEWKHPSELRQWGKFMTYYDSKQTKIKKLVIEPNKSISMQYHNSRSEFWFVESGEGKIYTLIDNKEVFLKTVSKHDYYHVDVRQWHRIENPNTAKLEIVEIQYGDQCVEQDIVRSHF